MFDDFYYCCRIKPAKPLVSVHQGALDQVEADLLSLRELIELEFLLRNPQRAPGNIHTKNGLELLVSKQVPEQLAFPATKIENPLRTVAAQNRQNRPHALFMQPKRPFDLLFLFIARTLLLLFGFRLISRQAVEGFTSQAFLSLEIPRHDEVSLRVLTEPSFPTVQQLFDLVVPNPVVLLVVQDGDEDV